MSGPRKYKITIYNFCPKKKTILSREELFTKVLTENEFSKLLKKEIKDRVNFCYEVKP